MSDLAGSVTVGLTAEADQFKADMREAAQTVRQFQADAVTASAKSVPALNQITQAGASGADEMTAAQQRFIQGLQRQVAAIQGGKIAAQELRAAQLGIGDAAAPLLATWRQLEAAQRDTASAAATAGSAIKTYSESEAEATARIRASVAASLEKTAALQREIDASRQASAAAREGGGRSAPASVASIDFAAQNRSLQDTADLVAEVNRSLASIGRGASSQSELQAQTDKLVSLWSQGRVSADQYAASVKQLDLSEAQLNKTSAEATARADAFMAKLRDQAATAGKSAKELLEYRAAQLGVTDKATPFIQQIEASNKAMHGFSLETGGARRELGVLARELARGDFGAASRSFSIFAERAGLMTTLLSPAALAIGALAAGVGVATVAYMRGHEEQKKFSDALIITGNAAGTTAGSLHEIAVGAAGALGSLSSAKEAVLALANGGKQTADQIARIATVAVEMETATGKAIQNTIREFEEIGRSPVDASIKLNEQYHYLTQAVYDQIAALEKQGDRQAAVELAERTYASAMGERAASINEHIGSIESAWKKAKNAAASFWDTVMNVGRTDMLEHDIAEYEKRIKTLSNPDDRKILEERVAGLRQQLSEQQASAARKKEAEESAEASVLAARSVDQLTESFDKNIKKRNELAKVSAEFTAMMRDANLTTKFNPRLENVVFDEAGTPLSGGLYDTLIKGIEDKYKDRKSSGGDNSLNAKIEEIRGAMQEAERALRLSVQNNKSLYDAGLLDTQEYLKADYEARKDALAKELVLAQQQAQVAGQKKNLSAAQAAKNQIAKIRDEQTENEQKFSNDTASLLHKGERAFQAYVDSLSDSYNTRAQAIQNMIAGTGLGDIARDELNRLNQVQQAFDRSADSLRKERDKGEAHGGISDEEYARRLTALQINLDQQVAMEQAATEEIRKSQQDGWMGASRFLQNYADQAANTASQIENLFSGAARGMEDAWANFVTTGKLSFSDLAKSVIADIAKMQARAAISGLFNFAFSAISSYMGGGVATSQIGGAGAGATSFGVQPGSTFGSLGSGFSGLTVNALGGVYDSPDLSRFSGSVVSKPTLFAFAKGAGLMGEAGEEGIFPLKRGPNGALGIQAFGGGSTQSMIQVNVTVNSDGSSEVTAPADQKAFGNDLAAFVDQRINRKFRSAQRDGGALSRSTAGYV